MTHLARHPRLAPGPVARDSAIRWGRSLLDLRFHAVDELADHPSGCYRSECGHVLLAVTVLHTEPIGDRICEACMAVSRPLDHLWRALPGEPLCADGARRCVLVAGHGDDVEHTARDGATWGAA
jgi:hypothetical protein